MAALIKQEDCAIRLQLHTMIREMVLAGEDHGATKKAVWSPRELHGMLGAGSAGVAAILSAAGGPISVLKRCGIITDPHTYVDPQVDIRNFPSEHPIGYAFLNGKDLSLLRQLIEDRRSLPVYRAGCWLCYECSFESADLTATARHIVRAHGSAAVSEDDLDEDGADLVC